MLCIFLMKRALEAMKHLSSSSDFISCTVLISLNFTYYIPPQLSRLDTAYHALEL